LSPHGVEESAYLPLRYSHPFLLQQLSQVCPHAVFFELAIDRPVLLVPKIIHVYCDEKYVAVT
jgi:hypothetical protein